MIRHRSRLTTGPTPWAPSGIPIPVWPLQQLRMQIKCTECVFGGNDDNEADCLSAFRARLVTVLPGLDEHLAFISNGGRWPIWQLRRAYVDVGNKLDTNRPIHVFRFFASFNIDFRHNDAIRLPPGLLRIRIAAGPAPKATLH